ncbi:unnamed protein product [Symbiodinium sp. CCMP2592]|nr:unnamed protein product [Symbiodinium sp. CCMP2592]
MGKSWKPNKGDKQYPRDGGAESYYRLWRGAYSPRAPWRNPSDADYNAVAFPSYTQVAPKATAPTPSSETKPPPGEMQLLQKAVTAAKKAENKVRKVVADRDTNSRQWDQYLENMKNNYIQEFLKHQKDQAWFQEELESALVQQETARQAVKRAIQGEPIQEDPGTGREQEIATSWQNMRDAWERPMDVDFLGVIQRAMESMAPDGAAPAPGPKRLRPEVVGQFFSPEAFAFMQAQAGFASAAAAHGAAPTPPEPFPSHPPPPGFGHPGKEPGSSASQADTSGGAPPQKMETSPAHPGMREPGQHRVPTYAEPPRSDVKTATKVSPGGRVDPHGSLAQKLDAKRQQELQRTAMQPFGIQRKPPETSDGQVLDDQDSDQDPEELHRAGADSNASDCIPRWDPLPPDIFLVLIDVGGIGSSSSSRKSGYCTSQPFAVDHKVGWAALDVSVNRMTGLLEHLRDVSVVQGRPPGFTDFLEKVGSFLVPLGRAILFHFALALYMSYDEDFMESPRLLSEAFSHQAPHQRPWQRIFRPLLFATQRAANPHASPTLFYTHGIAPQKKHGVSVSVPVTPEHFLQTVVDNLSPRKLFFAADLDFVEPQPEEGFVSLLLVPQWLEQSDLAEIIFDFSAVGGPVYAVIVAKHLPHAQVIEHASRHTESPWDAFQTGQSEPLRSDRHIRVVTGDTIKFVAVYGSPHWNPPSTACLRDSDFLSADIRQIVSEEVSDSWLILAPDIERDILHSGQPDAQLQEHAASALHCRGDQLTLCIPDKTTFQPLVYQGALLAGVIAARQLTPSEICGAGPGVLIVLDCRPVGRKPTFFRNRDPYVGEAVLLHFLDLRPPRGFQIVLSGLPRVGEAFWAYNGSVLRVDFEPSCLTPLDGSTGDPTDTGGAIAMRNPYQAPGGCQGVPWQRAVDVTRDVHPPARFDDEARTPPPVAFTRERPQVPCAQDDALNEVQEARNEDQSLYFDTLLPVEPQPDNRFACILSLPEWATTLCHVLVDLRQVDGRLFSITLPDRLSRASLLASVALADAPRLRIFLADRLLPAEGDIVPENGGLITFVPDGRHLGPLYPFDELLGSERNWAIPCPMYPGPIRSAVLICNDDVPKVISYEPTPADTLTVFRRVVASFLGYDPADTILHPSNPAIEDVEHFGYTCKSICVATRHSNRPTSGEGHDDTHIVILDTRPILRDIEWLTADQGRLDFDGLCARFDAEAPPGHATSIKGGRHELRAEGTLVHVPQAGILVVQYIPDFLENSPTSNDAELGGQEQEDAHEDSESTCTDSSDLSDDDGAEAGQRERSRTPRRIDRAHCLASTGDAAMLPTTHGITTPIAIDSKIEAYFGPIGFSILLDLPSVPVWFGVSWDLCPGFSTHKLLGDSDSCHASQWSDNLPASGDGAQATANWTYTAPPDHREFTIDQEGGQFDGVLHPPEDRQLHFVVAAIDYSLRQVEVTLSIPAVPPEALAAVRDARPSADRRRFPILHPAHPQPVPGVGVFIAEPSWGPQPPTICVDTRLIDGRLFAYRGRTYADRFALLHLAGLPPQLAIDVYVGQDLVPLPDGTDLHLTSGVTVRFVPAGLPVAPAAEFADCLRNPAWWSLVPYPATHSPVTRYGLVLDGQIILHETDVTCPTRYKHQIATCIGLPVSGFTLCPANPRTTDCAISGHPVRAIIGIVEGTQAASPAFCALVDCRPQCNGWFTIPLNGGRIDAWELLDNLDMQAPRGWRSLLVGHPSSQQYAAAYPGSVFVAEYAPSRPAPIPLLHGASHDEASTTPLPAVPQQAGDQISAQPRNGPNADSATPAASSADATAEDLQSSPSQHATSQPSAFVTTTFCILGQHYEDEVVRVRIPVGTTPSEAVEAVSAARDPAVRSYLPRVGHVPVQSLDGIAVLVGLPLWDPSGALIVLDGTRAGSTIHVAQLPGLVQREGLLIAAGFPPNSDLEVYLKDIPWPIQQGSQVSVRHGDTAIFVPPGHAHFVTTTLQAILSSTEHWNSTWTPSPPDGERAWVLTPDAPFSFTISPDRRSHLRQDLLTAIGGGAHAFCSPEPLAPAYTHQGLIHDHIIAAIDPVPFSEPDADRRIFCFVDARPLLLRVECLLAYDGILPCARLQAQYASRCPPGFVLCYFEQDGFVHPVIRDIRVRGFEVVVLTFLPAHFIPDPQEPDSSLPPHEDPSSRDDEGPDESQEDGDSAAASQQSVSIDASTGVDAGTGGSRRFGSQLAHTHSIATSFRHAATGRDCFQIHGAIIPRGIPSARRLSVKWNWVNVLPALTRGLPGDTSDDDVGLLRWILLLLALCGALFALSLRALSRLPALCVVGLLHVLLQSHGASAVQLGDTAKVTAIRPPNPQGISGSTVARPVPTPCRNVSLGGTGHTCSTSEDDDLCCQLRELFVDRSDALCTLLECSRVDSEDRPLFHAWTLLETLLEHQGSDSPPTAQDTAVLGPSPHTTVPRGPDSHTFGVGELTEPCNLDSRTPQPIRIGDHLPLCQTFDLAAVSVDMGVSLDQVMHGIACDSWPLQHRLPELGDLHPAARVFLSHCSLVDQGTWSEVSNSLSHVDLYTDGSFDGNLSSWAFVAFGWSETTCYFLGWQAGVVQTSPQLPDYIGADTHHALAGEYSALVWALYWGIQACTFPSLAYHSDCLSALQQANGQWGSQSGDPLMKASRALLQLLCSVQPAFKGAVDHVHSHQGQPGNELADSLAKFAVRTTYTARLSSRAKELAQAIRDGSVQWWWLIHTGAVAPQAWPQFYGSHLSDHHRFSDNSPPSDLEAKAWFGYESDLRHKPDLTRLLTLRLLTVNVQTLNDPSVPACDSRDFKGRAGFLREQLDSLNIHVAALQETRALASDTITSHSHIRFCSGKDSAGCLGVELWFSRLLPFLGDRGSKTYFQPGDFLVAFADPRSLVVRFARGSIKILFVCVHGPTTCDPQRESWWAMLHERLHRFSEAHEVVLLGDYNTHFAVPIPGRVGSLVFPGSGSVPTGLQKILHTQDIWLPATFPDIHQGASLTWVSPSGSSGSRIDFVGIPCTWIAGPQSSCVQTDLDWGQGHTDHYAAQVEVSALVRASMSGPHRVRLDREAMCTTEGQIVLSEIWKQVPQVPWSTNVHRHWAALEGYLRGELTKAFPNQRGQCRSSHFSEHTWHLRQRRVWLRRQILKCRDLLLPPALRDPFLAWQRKCRLAVTKLSGSLRVMHLQSRLSGFATELRQTRKILRQAVRQDIQHRIVTVAAEAEHCATAEAVRRLKPLLGPPKRKARTHKGLPLVLTANGTPATTAEEVEDTWVQHFAGIEDGRKVQPAQLAASCMSIQSGRDLELISFNRDDIPSRIELEVALRATSVGRASGLDGVPGEALHCAVAAASEALYPLLLKTSLRLAEPVQFKGGSLEAAWKGKGSPAVCASHRGILISAVTGKAFHRLLRSRCVGPLTSAIAKVAATIRLPHGVLHELHLHLTGNSVFEGSGASSWLSGAMSEVLEATWFRFKAGPSLVQTGIGSRPGDNCADIVFSFLFSKVLQELSKDMAARGCTTQLPYHDSMRDDIFKSGAGPPHSIDIFDATWMDDLALMMLSDSAESIVTKAGHVTGLLVDACLSRALLPNLARGKTELIIVPSGTGSKGVRASLFRDKDPSIEIPSRLWPGARVRVVNSYRHLGGTIHFTGDLSREVRSRVALAHEAFQKRKRHIFGSPTVPKEAKATLYNSLILSVLLHGAGTWPGLSAAALSSLSSAYERMACHMCRPHWDFDQALHSGRDQVLAYLGLPSVAVLLHIHRLRHLLLFVRLQLDQLWALAHWENEWLATVRLSLAWLWDIVRPSKDTRSWEDLWPEWLQLLHKAPGKWKSLLKRAQARAVHIEAWQAAYHRHCALLVHQLQRNGAISYGSTLDQQDQVHCCALCRTTFSTRQKWSVHAFKCHGRRMAGRGILPGLQCQACLRTYPSNVRLCRHLRYSLPCRTKLLSLGYSCSVEPGVGHRKDDDKAVGLCPALSGSGPLQLFPQLPDVHQEVCPVAEVWDCLRLIEFDGPVLDLSDEELWDRLRLSFSCVCASTDRLRATALSWAEFLHATDGSTRLVDCAEWISTTDIVAWLVPTPTVRQSMYRTYRDSVHILGLLDTSPIQPGSPGPLTPDLVFLRVHSGSGVSPLSLCDRCFLEFTHDECLLAFAKGDQPAFFDGPFDDVAFAIDLTGLPLLQTLPCLDSGLSSGQAELGKAILGADLLRFFLRLILLRVPAILVVSPETDLCIQSADEHVTVISSAI